MKDLVRNSGITGITGEFSGKVSMRRVLFLLSLVLLLTAFAAQSSFADMSSGKMGKGMHKEGISSPGKAACRCAGMRSRHHTWKALMGLGLDEKQKDAMREIRSRVAKDNVRKGADIRIARIELRDILEKDPVDMGAVEAKLRQVESLRTELRLARIKALEEVKAQLTPDQRKQFKANLRQAKWAHGRGGMEQPCGKMKGDQHPMEHDHL